jgi:DNA-binding NarL/FixJ family response regulator
VTWLKLTPKKYIIKLYKIHYAPYLPFLQSLVKWKKTGQGKTDMFKTLIVEDSTFFRQLLKEALISRFPSMDIFEATDGEEALQKIEVLLPDLVFMDIKLPGESGLELTKKIKAQYPNIIIIILTAYDIPEYREAAYQYNANYFLSKGSTSKEDILTLVDSILSDRRIDNSGSKSENL